MKKLFIIIFALLFLPLVFSQAVPFTGCNAGEKICSQDAKQLLTCNTNGDGYTSINCKYGCQITDSGIICVQSPDNSNFYSILLVLGILIIILLVIILVKIKKK